ncbi:MAG: glycine cleavage system protein GcvH [Thermoprotei archaeon]|nr:MAG: glycine cleavage system protein GcvH [Thermoprotei archaeon]
MSMEVLGYKVVSDRKYTKSDEWVKIENDIAIIGITDYAQRKLRNIVAVELPEINKEVRAGESIAVVESIKTIADVYTPISGIVTEVNEVLMDRPELINDDPYGEGWIVKIKIKDRSELEKLLTPEQYAELIKEREH